MSRLFWDASRRILCHMSSRSDIGTRLYTVISSMTARLVLFISFAAILATAAPRIFSHTGSLEGPDVAHADVPLNCLSCADCASSCDGCGSSGACACSCEGAGCGTGTGCGSDSSGDCGNKQRYATRKELFYEVSHRACDSDRFYYCCCRDRLLVYTNVRVTPNRSLSSRARCEYS